MPESLSTDQLFTLYKIALEEYRFQVRLNWDRTTYHLTLNSGLIAIATGLLKLGSPSRVNLAVAAVFFIGMCASAIGIKTIRKGHEYYRRTVVKKTLLEDQLGLTKPLENYAGAPTLAVGTTVVRALETAARVDGQIRPYRGETDLFMTPGCPFKLVDALLTNFHLPRTTLLMLVSALAGTEFLRQAYAEAVRERYRFYSYGDAMLIL